MTEIPVMRCFCCGRMKPIFDTWASEGIDTIDAGPTTLKLPLCEDCISVRTCRCDCEEDQLENYGNHPDCIFAKPPPKPTPAQKIIANNNLTLIKELSL